MGQHQSRFSLSVGTKILLSVVALLLLMITALNATTIRILFEDKRTYTLQAQSVEASVAARDLENSIRSALDSLRIALGSIDPVKPLTQQSAQKERFKSVVQNQSEAAAIGVGLVRLDSGATELLVQEIRAVEDRSLATGQPQFAPRPALVKELLPELTQSGFALFNHSEVGFDPYLGVAVADLELKDSPRGMPVAFGYLPLRGFGGDVRASELIIATRTGAVLFANRPELVFGASGLIADPLYRASLASPVANGTTEYVANEVKYLGSFVRTGLDFVVLTRTEWRKAMGAAYALIERFMLLGGMAIGLAIIFSILFSKSMTRPLQRLFLATQEVSAGNFDIQLKSESSDEIGVLTDSFVSMSKKINELIKEQVRKAHLENEVAIASTVQQTLIPGPKFDNPLIQIRGHYQSASECGGDWWGYFGVGNRLCILIADATGHGLPSALITASARSCFSVMHKLAQEEPEFGYSPGAMLAYANRVVHDAASGKIMMTFFAAVIDFEEGTLTYSSAGHNPPWLFKKNDAGKYVLNSLVATGQRLGEARDVPPFEEKSIAVGPEDVFFLYTDGLTEGKNLEGEMFGKKRVRKIVEAAVAEGPEKIISSLLEEFVPYNEGKDFDDDVTLAVAKIQSLANSGAAPSA